MMDYELNLDGWLEDVTLFPNEPNDYSFTFDDLKTNTEAVPVIELYNDLPWFDEKVDLSLIEETSAPIDDLSDVQLTEKDFNDLFSLISNNSDSFNLSSIALNPNSDDLNIDLDLQSHTASPGSDIFSNSYTSYSSPEYEPISEAESPDTLPLSPDSDYTETGSPPTASSPDLAPCDSLDVSTEYITSDLEYKPSMPAVFVTVCNDVEDTAQQVAESVSLEDISESMKKREFVAKGREIRKVRLSSDSTFHPYSKGRKKRGSSNSDRKKVQNKEAAARYRIKKRIEEQELSGEVADLEAEQRDLISKKDDLESEIKCLKKFLKELLEKKGKL